VTLDITSLRTARHSAASASSRRVLACLAVLFACACKEPAMADPAPDFLDELVPALAKTRDVDALLAKAPPTIKVTKSADRWSLSFAARDTAKALARWKWRDIYAVSGDVHQRRFGLRRSAGAIAKDRIATTDPHAGRYAIRVTLTERPKGALPKLVAGASPAYPLPQYASTFDHVEIVLRDIVDIDAALTAIPKPTMADIERELGPADRDVGSGIHVLEYDLGSMKLHVGTPDYKDVLYVRIGTRDLYRKK
jgi:hypothetical protein